MKSTRFLISGFVLALPPSPFYLQQRSIISLKFYSDWSFGTSGKLGRALGMEKSRLCSFLYHPFPFVMIDQPVS